MQPPGLASHLLARARAGTPRGGNGSAQGVASRRFLPSSYALRVRRVDVPRCVGGYRSVPQTELDFLARRWRWATQHPQMMGVNGHTRTCSASSAASSRKRTSAPFSQDAQVASGGPRRLSSSVSPGSGAATAASISRLYASVAALQRRTRPRSLSRWSLWGRSLPHLRAGPDQRMTNASSSPWEASRCFRCYPGGRRLRGTDPVAAVDGDRPKPTRRHRGAVGPDRHPRA